MITQFTTRRINQIPLILLFTACGALAMPALAQEQIAANEGTQYRVSNLDSLGGTSSAGNSINDRSWVAGYSKLTGDQVRHAALWRRQTHHAILDLGTLGGPNSSITWNVKNTEGILVGISQTADPEPLGEAWSSAAFYSGPYATGFINLAFVLEDRQMRALPNFPGGDNGFATGANNLRQVVGWAENDVHDPTCVSPQVLQFHPAVWTLGPPDVINDLPLISGDSSGAATAINDNGQIVGLSCDADGNCRAFIWENGAMQDLNDLKQAGFSATLETAKDINDKGEITGRALDPNTGVRTAYVAIPKHH